jgi:hypothetical protein
MTGRRSAPLPALVGAVMVGWTAATAGPWLVLAGVGVLAAALTAWRWPGTAATVATVLGQAAHGPTIPVALLAGLLATGYLVLLAGPPPVTALASLALGAALASAVGVGAVLLAARPSVWWVLAASAAAPVALLLARSGRPEASDD